MTDQATIHASAVLIGAKAALIRGPSGSGKSQLALALIEAAGTGTLPFARLVSDDRTHVEAVQGRLLLRPAPALEGMIEVHGLGIRRLPFEPLAVAGLVVDLQAPDAARHPAAKAAQTLIDGISLPRLAVAGDRPALSLVLAFVGTCPFRD